MSKVVVVIEGGTVRDVLTTDPVEVAVIDYDTDGVEESELKKIPQMSRGGHSVFAEAVGGVHSVDVNPERAEELFAAIR